MPRCLRCNKFKFVLDGGDGLCKDCAEIRRKEKQEENRIRGKANAKAESALEITKMIGDTARTIVDLYEDGLCDEVYCERITKIFTTATEKAGIAAKVVRTENINRVVQTVDGFLEEIKDLHDQSLKVLSEVSSDPRHEIVSSGEKHVLMEFLGQQKAYEYDDVKLYIVPGQEPVFDDLELGMDIDFIQEPNNKYDSRAVFAATSASSGYGQKKIGYLYRGKLQDMVNDFIDSCLPILAHIESVDSNNGVVKIHIAFYRNKGGCEDTEFEYEISTKF